jgi:tripartite-type tricarboxylate transporter receptor subunit TctC
MAPAGTPRDIVEKLSRALNDALKSEALLGQFKKMGYEPLGGTAEQFSSYVAGELRKWTAAAEAAGVRK